MNFKKLLPHLAAIGIFIILSCVYFSPVFSDYSLKQSDVQQFRGMAKEIVDANLVNEEKALWTNSMFSGMPAYQISVVHENNFMRIVDSIVKFGLPGPVGALFIMMLGFYIFALCLRVNPWIGILGSIAFGFSTINILYLGAGHITKVNAIAYMAPTLGGLILAFRGKIFLGAAIFSLFFALNITANHLQMTYYLSFLLAIVVLEESIRLIFKKEIKDLFKIGMALGIASLIAILPSYGNLSTTLEYSKYTTRGATELTIKPKGQEKEKNKDGLDPNYILEYNYGKGELLSIIAPNAKGERGDYLGNDEEVMLEVDPKYADNIGQMNRYWGGQRMSGGAFYFGVFMLVFAIFGLFFVKDSLKWAFLVVAILSLLLASNDPGGLNHFFLNKFPLYNKFRDSKMILVLLQLVIPALAVLFLDKLFRRDGLVENKKVWLIACGAVTLVGIALYTFPSISGSMLSEAETTQFEDAIRNAKDPASAEFVDGLKIQLTQIREGIYKSDFARAIGIILLGCGLILLAIYSKLSTFILSIIGIVFVSADNISVCKRYLNTEDIDLNTSSWVDVAKFSNPYSPDVSDLSILSKESKLISAFDSKVSALKSAMPEHDHYANLDNSKLESNAQFGALNLNSDYRVLNFSNPFNETGTSYFHKSIGGYHGAKLKRYQELIDFYLGSEMMKVRQEFVNKGISKRPEVMQQYAAATDEAQKGQIIEQFFQTSNFDSVQLQANLSPILNMLNVKYFVTGKGVPATENMHTNGAVWFVSKIKKVNNANKEMLELGKLDTKQEAVVDMSLLDKSVNLNENYSVDSLASIKLVKYNLNELQYSSKSKSELPAIFSEIYYPEGWNCYIDGELTPTFKANYLLRAAIIPAGDHSINWKFEPESFYLGSKVALIGSIILLLFVAFVFWKELKSTVKELSSKEVEQGV